MKELFLTDAQIKRLAKGGEVKISRKGCTIILASKKAAKVGVVRSRTIQRLEQQLAKLKQQDNVTPPNECDVCHKKVWKLGIHKALAHEGRKSNLPQLKQRS
jgi:hypothetical protein